jgi:putative ABC transport system substrate-binding protein
VPTRDRRRFVLALSAIVVAPALRGQPARVYRVGVLRPTAAGGDEVMSPGLARALRDLGYVEGRNLVIDTRFADNKISRLPALAQELVASKVDAIVAVGESATRAAKAATTTIPIVFTVGFDPIAAGLVTSLNRPGGNATGVTLLTSPLAQKRIEILLELVPSARSIAMIVNPKSPDTEHDVRDARAAAQANGRALTVVDASTPAELAAAFATVTAQRPDALLAGSDPFFIARRHEFVTLAARLKVPAIYPFREFTEVGGLISYGTNIANAFRQSGIYAGRILKGAKPADLPVLQPITFELVINLKTARALGFDIPPTLHARSDEVIE